MYGIAQVSTDITLLSALPASEGFEGWEGEICNFGLSWRLDAN